MPIDPVTGSIVGALASTVLSELLGGLFGGNKKAPYMPPGAPKQLLAAQGQGVPQQAAVLEQAAQTLSSRPRR